MEAAVVEVNQPKIPFRRDDEVAGVGVAETDAQGYQLPPESLQLADGFADPGVAHGPLPDSVKERAPFDVGIDEVAIAIEPATAIVDCGDRSRCGDAGVGKSASRLKRLPGLGTGEGMFQGVSQGAAAIVLHDIRLRVPFD